MAFASFASSRSVFLPDHRALGLTDDVVGVIDGRFSEAEQDVLLAACPAQLLGQLLLRLRIRTCADLCTSPNSKSTSAAVISDAGTQHNAANKV
ncbi:hypothetical protein [Nocardia sp. SC052]|uniref:hypothetical protein n=1 Tax=Nocardia sichangensis TaxID=3385975 RepID=UPI0039A013AC